MRRPRHRKFRRRLLLCLSLGAALIPITYKLFSDYFSNDAAGEVASEEQRDTLADRLLLLLPRLPQQRKEVAVQVVTIQSGIEPLPVLNDACKSRAFLTVLVPLLAEGGATTIAIDKMYSGNSCLDPDINQAFRKALAGAHKQNTRADIVVGLPLRLPSPGAKSCDNNCLVEGDVFDFSNKGEVDVSHIHTAAPQLDSDTLQLPLGWKFVKDQDQESGEGYPVPSLSLQTAELADNKRPDVKPNDRLANDTELQRLLGNNDDPYALLRRPDEIPRVSAMRLLCSGARDEVLKNQWGECNNLPLPRLAATVFVGDITATDVHNFPTGQVSGVVLQALYTQALLDRAYLSPIDLGFRFELEKIMLLLVVVAAFGLMWWLQKEHPTAFLIPLWTCLFLFVLDLALIYIWHRFLPSLWYGSLSLGISSLTGFIDNTPDKVSEAARTAAEDSHPEAHASVKSKARQRRVS